jgi:hypothetical protein
MIGLRLLPALCTSEVRDAYAMWIAEMMGGYHRRPSTAPLA